MNSRFWFHLNGYIAMCLGFLIGTLRPEASGVFLILAIMTASYWLGYAVIYRGRR